jgi:hypothetical protein
MNNSNFHKLTKKKKKHKIINILLSLCALLDETNSLVNIAKTQWTNHILKGLYGKPVQNYVHIPILITPLLDQRAPQPNTQMRQLKV